MCHVRDFWILYKLMKSICILGKQSDKLFCLQRETTVSPYFSRPLQQTARVTERPTPRAGAVGLGDAADGTRRVGCSIPCPQRARSPLAGGVRSRGRTGTWPPQRKRSSSQPGLSPTAVTTATRGGARGEPSWGHAAACWRGALLEIISLSQDLMSS